MRATRVGVSRQFARMIDAAEAVGIIPPNGHEWQLQHGDAFTSWAIHFVDVFTGSLHNTGLVDALGNIGRTTGEAFATLATISRTLEAVAEVQRVKVGA